jgi:hypothetical protein
LINFFKKKSILNKGDTYAVQTGDYVGELLIFMKSDDENYHFLAPNKVNRAIPKEKFDFGLEHHIIEFVETIPKNIFKVLERQFENNQRG